MEKRMGASIVNETKKMVKPHVKKGTAEAIEEGTAESLKDANFDILFNSANKHASDIKKELIEIAKESDATIRRIDKEIDALQAKTKKAGALATQLEKEAKEIDKVDTLVKSNTAYKSKDKVVKTNREGEPITQEDIWKQDKERIEKSRKLTNEQKEDLKDLSIHQKQLNTLKENALNTIDEINKKEEKTEEDIIKQYKAAVNLKKVLEEMEQTKAEISKIIGKDKYDETSKITVPKSIIPNKENVSAKDAVEKYIEDYKLESKLKQVYNRDLKQKEAEKTKYLEDKAIKEDTKQYEKAEKNQKKVAKKLEETNKELANKAKEFDEQFKKLEQDTITSVMEYIKVADKTTEKSSDSMKKAFKDLATYINSGGDLNNINEGLEKLLQADSNLVNKKSDLFKERIKELQDILAGKKSLQDVADYHFTKGDLLFKIDTDKQTDTNLENLKKEQKELEKTKKIYEENIEAREKALNSNATDENADVPSSRIQGDIPVSVVPEVEPEEFVSKITEQLKGHSVKVDVELNSENIAEEVKKIKEMIPDKKEIEISVTAEKDLGNVKSNKSALESETNTNKTENKPDTTKKNNGLQITVDVVPEFNPDEFIQDITSKLKGKEVPIDVVPSENSEKFLDRISAYSEKMNILSKEDIEQLVNKQDIPLNVTPKLETPENFAKEVTNQLKGTSAKIDVKPQITDKAISDLLKEQTKSKSVSVSAPKLDAKNLIEEFNLQEKDIDSNITSKVRDLSKEINKLSKEAIETNSDKSWEGLVSHIKELANILNSYGKIRLDTSQFESVLKIAEQLKDSRIFIGDNVKNDVLSGAGADNLRQLNNEFINLGVTFTTTRDKAMNLDDVWDEFIQSTGRMDLADITTGADRLSKIIEELREAKNVLYGDKGLISADKYGTSEMVSYMEQVEKKQKEYAKVNPDKAEEYQKNIDFITKEISTMKELDSVVNQITTSVDEKTNAFREEEQVVTRTVQREISELERLSGELFSIRQDIENISSTITALPKFDFDVDLSKLNIENIDNAAIASFNTFREQLAGLEAQLNVSNLSEKLLHISEAFEKLSKVDNLENLNTKNLEITPITNLAEKAGSITELVEALNGLKECLDGLKTTSFDKEQFDGLKLTKANVNNMADMAVALETIGIALQSFDKDAKESLSSINELLNKSESLKDINSFMRSTEKDSIISIDSNDNIVLEDIVPSDKQFKNAISNLDMVEEKMMDIVRITKKGKKDSDGNFVEDYVVSYRNGSSETYKKDADSNKARLSSYSYIKADAKAEEKAMLEVQKQITKEIDEQTAEQQKIWKLFLEEVEVQEQITKEIEKQNKAQQEKGRAFIEEQNNYISSKQEAEAKDRNIKANQELIDTIQRYSDIKKRIAKGDMFDGDIEEAEILEQKISELQKQPILHTSQIEASERSLQNLYDTLDTIERKTKKNKKAKETKAPTTSTVNKSNSISDNISNGTYKKSVDEVTARFSKLNKEVKYNENLVKELDSAYDKLKSADGIENKIQTYKDIENKIQAYKEFEKALASARNELSSLEQKSKALDFAGKLEKQFEAIANEYKDLSYLSSSLETLRNELTRIQNEAKESGADLSTLAQDARQAFAVFNKGVLPSGDFVGSFGNLDEAIEKAKSMVNEYDKVKTELKTPLQVNNNGIAKMTAQVVDLNGELKTLTFVYNDVTKTMVKQTTNIRKELSGIPGVIDAVKSKLKDMAVYWTATAFDPYDIINGFREIYDVVKELDDQFVEMQKVSDESVASLKEYQNLSFDKADEVGTTASQLESSTADFMRIGEALNEAAESAKTANTLLNVSEFDSIDAATKSLTAMSQAYSELDKMEIVDKLNLAGNNFSISTAELAEALQDSAAALKTQGNDINEAISLIVAGNAIGQNANSTGAGMRTIALRISGTEEAKDELASLGEDVDDFVVQTQSKTDKIIRDYTAVASNSFKGVSVLDENGNLRDTFEILLDISKVYKEILETDKKAGTNRGQALIEELAGKNRANIAASILMNGDMLQKVYDQVQNADGSAQQELDKYLDSISGKTIQLQNQLQKLASVTIDTDSFKTLLDIANGLLDTITDIVDALGSVEMIIGGLGAFFAQKNGLDQFKNCIIY